MMSRIKPWVGLVAFLMSLGLVFICPGMMSERIPHSCPMEKKAFVIGSSCKTAELIRKQRAPEGCCAEKAKNIYY